MSSNSQTTITIASASPQPLDASWKENEMRASFMMKQNSHKIGANQMFDNTEYSKKKKNIKVH